MGVLEAAKETGAPVIFQMFSRLADTNDGNFVAPAILEAIRQLPQPAVMHLDHGAGIPEVVRAIRLGMTGVMIDASTLPLGRTLPRRSLRQSSAAMSAFRLRVSSAMSARRRTRCSATIPMSRRQSAL